MAHRLLGRAPEAPGDARGGRVVAVIGCILNQNLRDAGAASSAAMNREVVELCLRYEVGMLQMPCPEAHVLGLGRARPAGHSIRQALDTEPGRQACSLLAAGVVDELEAYLASGQEVLAVLGGNPASPGCAVHVDERAGGRPIFEKRSGVFILALARELSARGLEVPFRAMRDADPELVAQDLVWLEGRLRPARP